MYFLDKNNFSIFSWTLWILGSCWGLQDRLVLDSVADPDRFGPEPDPDPTSENRPDSDPDPVKTGSGFI
jgi:hypothetical protein